MADLVWQRIDDEIRARSARRRSPSTWADLGRLIGATDQAMTNWRTRGVPAKRHADIARALDWTVDQLLGLSPVPNSGRIVPAKVISFPQQSVAHGMSQFTPEDSPLIPWEKLKMGEQIPARFWTELPDDSMGPRWPKGTRVLVDASTQPQGGEAVVVMDAAGGTYFRRYVRRSGSRWYAEALADGYARLDSEDDGLRLVGVAIAVWGRLMA